MLSRLQSITRIEKLEALRLWPVFYSLRQNAGAGVSGPVVEIGAAPNQPLTRWRDDFGTMHAGAPPASYWLNHYRDENGQIQNGIINHDSSRYLDANGVIHAVPPGQIKEVSRITGYATLVPAATGQADRPLSQYWDEEGRLKAGAPAASYWQNHYRDQNGTVHAGLHPSSYYLGRNGVAHRTGT